jgi:hypothetical protein
MKEGDVLVFIGKDISIENEHFKNFNYGSKYQISNISMVGYGVDDDVPPMSAVFFKDHEYGCLAYKISEFFVTLDEFRDTNLDEIIKNF